MFRWTPYTFVRTSTVFIGGILLGVYAPESIPLSFAAATVLILFATYFLFHASRQQFLTRTLGAIGLSVVFLLGYAHVHFQTHRNQADHLYYHSDSIQYYRAVIHRYSEEKAKSWKTEALVTHVFSSGEWSPAKAKVLLYFSKTDFSNPLRYGDVLIIRGKPREMNEPANPGEFDYKRYLSFRNIYHQHFLKSADVKVVGNEPPSLFIKSAYACREWCENVLKKFVTGSREQAVASALVLGVTDGLDNELLNAYSATGAMHVLAVSGLHISILYMIIMWVLKPLLKLRSGAWMLAISSLFLLWLYAFITGLSPSVLRAVTMFSFMAIARPTGLTTNIYNTLSASAFCLLLFDPYLIMSVGFQLSYMAVLGIVYLQRPLYNLWSPNSYLLDETWKITCVSIAAQVATFSLGLLYFHQFPNYFLLSNLLVIPGSFVVLVLGIILLAVNFVSFLGIAFGFLLTWSIKFINHVVFIVESFPFSLVENIYITTFQSWLIMLAIVAVIFMFQFRSLRFFYVSCLFCLGFSFLQWQHHLGSFQKEKFTVYNVAGQIAFDFIADGKAVFFGDSILFNDREKTRFHLHPNRLSAGVQSVTFANASAAYNRTLSIGKVIQWRNTRLLHLDRKLKSIQKSFSANIIIISNNALSIDALNTSNSSWPLIILDSSNSYFYVKVFTAKAKALGLKVHAVSTQGAFEKYL